jgi:hypothetical protein
MVAAALYGSGAILHDGLRCFFAQLSLSPLESSRCRTGLLLQCQHARA